MAGQHDRAFHSEEVAAVYASMEPRMRRKLMRLRDLIFTTAAAIPGVGAIRETLRWNEPSYLTSASRSGSIIRLNVHDRREGRYAIYFHCQTTLVSSFRTMYGDALTFDGNRAITFALADRVPIAVLRDCIALALTYHSRRAR